MTDKAQTTLGCWICPENLSKWKRAGYKEIEYKPRLDDIRKKYYDGLIYVETRI